MTMKPSDMNGVELLQAYDDQDWMQYTQSSDAKKVYDALRAELVNRLTPADPAPAGVVRVEELARKMYEQSPLSKVHPWEKLIGDIRVKHITMAGYALAAISHSPQAAPDVCDVARKIIARDGDTCVKHGEPTELYWHIESCDACEHLRHLTLQTAKPAPIKWPEPRKIVEFFQHYDKDYNDGVTDSRRAYEQSQAPEAGEKEGR